jgi:hypothetical protein
MIKKIKRKCLNCGKKVDKLYSIEVSENGNTDFHEVCGECRRCGRWQLDMIRIIAYIKFKF